MRTLDEESEVPNNHRIQNNEIRENIIGIELENVRDTQIDQNASKNLIADLEER